MKKIIMLFCCLSIIPTIAFAVNRTARICNNTGQEIYVAIGWFNWTARASGWYTISDDSCRNMSFESIYAEGLFAFAISEDGNEYIPKGKKNQFCIEPQKSFDELTSSKCLAGTLAVSTLAGKIVEVSNYREFGKMSGFNSYEWTVE